MALNFPPKDPDEVLDYQINWAARLLSDTISTSTWTISDASLVQNSNSHAPQTATIWLSAGTLGQSYTLTNRVVTAGLRTMDQSVSISIKAK